MFKLPYGQRHIPNILLTAGLWVAFNHLSPFTRSLNEEKQNLLDLIEHKIGPSLMALNVLLPRWETTQNIHRRTR